MQLRLMMAFPLSLLAPLNAYKYPLMLSHSWRKSRPGLSTTWLDFCLHNEAPYAALLVID